MSQRKIPIELEPAVAELVKQKKPLRVIAEWLWTEHEIDASHMSVHRLVERLRFAEFGAPDIDAELAEARAQAGEQLRTLKALAEQFEELGERALEGDAKEGIKPDVRLAERLLARQARLITDWFRLLKQHGEARSEEWNNYQRVLNRADERVGQRGSPQEKAAMEQRQLQDLKDRMSRFRQALNLKSPAAAVL